MNNEENAYLYWLHNVPGVGDVKMRRLLNALGNAEAVYYANDKQLLTILKKKEVQDMRDFSQKWKVREAYQKMTDKGVLMMSEKDTDYPGRLRLMEQPPYILYYIGKLPKESQPAIAIVGARECSEYGAFMAKAFATRLAEAGVNIVSGMARGIDGIGQQAALEAGGSTFGVLGCGVDICYPASHRNLYCLIKEKGGILSPYPPGTMPQKNLFPYRNKIVAGLSDGVLVVEARQKSGTWITVDMALEQGKDVYAVPGRLTDRLSDGCNLLIKQGAGIVLSPEDLLAEIAVMKNRQEGIPKPAEKEKNEGLLSVLDFYPKSIDEILEQVQKTEKEMTISQLMFELIQLCMSGAAEQVSGNYFVKKGKV